MWRNMLLANANAAVCRGAVFRSECVCIVVVVVVYAFFSPGNIKLKSRFVATVTTRQTQ